MRLSRRVAVLDRSKLGKVMLTSVAPVMDLDLVITGKEGNPSTISQLRDTGLEVLLVRSMI